MKNRSIAIIVALSCVMSSLLLFTPLSAQEAAEGPYIAVAIKVTTDVYLRRSNKEELIPLQKDDKLYPGDRIICGDKGIVSMVFTDTSVELKLFPNSDMTLQGMRTAAGIVKRLFLPIGKLFSKVLNGNLEVVTPTSVASVKGTEWWTLVDSPDLTRIIVLEGEVQVKHRETDEIVVVEKGKTAASSSAGTLEIVPTKNDEIPSFDQETYRSSLEVEFESNTGDNTNLRIEFEK